VLVTAQRLFSEFGNFKGVANASIEELSKVKGIGVAEAAQLQASFELAKRVEENLQVQVLAFSFIIILLGTLHQV
jgi:DNA repair protein RadC